jgi:type I restriction enzyme R subunit
MIGICTRRKSEQFELMTKVLNDKLRQVKQKNIVETRRFSEMLERSILKLQNRTITTAQAIQQLIELAEEINKQSARGDEHRSIKR